MKLVTIDHRPRPSQNRPPPFNSLHLARNSVIKTSVRNSLSMALVFSSSVLLIALASTEAAQPKARIVKPNFVRPQIDRSQMEKPQREKISTEAPAIETSAMSSFSHGLAQRAKPQLDRPQFENPAFEDSFRNPNNGSQALFPHGRLHRKLRIREPQRSTDYINGPRIKEHRPRLRGHFLYHGKADREIAPD